MGKKSLNNKFVLVNTWNSCRQSTGCAVCSSKSDISFQGILLSITCPQRWHRKKKEKIWWIIPLCDQFVTCSRWEREGAADAIGQRQTPLVSHKRGLRGLFPLTHTHTRTHTETCAADFRDGRKSSKVKWSDFLFYCIKDLQKCQS